MKQGEQPKSGAAVTSRTFHVHHIPAFVYWLCVSLILALLIVGVIYLLITRSEQPRQALHTLSPNSQPVTLLDKGQAALAEAKTPQQKALAYEQIGNAYLNTNQPQKAADAFQQAVNESPNNIGYLTELSQAYITAGKKAQAATTLQKIIDLLQGSKDPYAARLVALYQSEIAQLQGKSD